MTAAPVVSLGTRSRSLDASSTATTSAPAGVMPPARLGAVGGAVAQPFAALTGQAQAAVAATASCAAWSPRERRAALGSVDHLCGLLAAARARLLAAERDAGTWALNGDRDLTSWRARTSRAGVREAAGQVRQAEAIVAMPQVGGALTAGAITTTHVDTIARFTATASPQVAERARSDSGQAAIVELATRLDGAQLSKALSRWQAEVDPVARQRAHDEQQAARYLNLSETSSGTYVKGLLDSIAGHRLRLALEAVSPRPGLDDDRTPEQRRADALAHLADRALDDTGPATGPAGRPHVSLVLTEPTWRALRAGAGRGTERSAVDGVAGTGTAVDRAAGTGTADDRAAGTGTADDGAPDARAAGTATAGGEIGPARPGVGSAVHVGGALLGVPPVCDEDGRPWPASEVGRVLCDCHLTRVVVDAESVPVDLGRTQRLFSAAQRRAATVRDGGCGWPGCGAPARWCELHHLTWWDRDGGPTDLRNAVLLCSFHHHHVHRRDLAIHREPPDPLVGRSPGERRCSRYRFTTPDGRDAVTRRVVDSGDP